MNSKGKIVIGSRGSKLALWQADHVTAELQKAGYQVELKIIKTKGDKIQNLSFDKLEGKGFFTKEIEEQLINNEIDIAVHSLKDLETDQPEGLCLAAMSKRNSPNDVLLIKESVYDSSAHWGLPENAVVGTSSARRQMWLKDYRPDLRIEDIRGNVPTRIKKLKDGSMDAIVLAEAGLNRINPDISGLKKTVLPVEEFVPAPAQGVLGIQTRANDAHAIKAAQVMSDPQSEMSSQLERAILNGVGGGCHVPFGAYCEVETNSNVRLRVAYSEDGVEIAKIDVTGHPDQLKDQVLAELKKKAFS